MTEPTNETGPAAEGTKQVQTAMIQCAEILATLRRPSDALWVIDRLKDGVLATIALAVLKTRELKGEAHDVPNNGA